MKTYQMTSPIFGPCWLRPHAIEDRPERDFQIGYVETKARPGVLTIAICKRGEWLNRQMKRMASPVVGWWSVEREDGSPVF